MGIGLGLGIQFYKKAGARLSEFLTWGQSVPTRFWGDETPEYWGGIDPQAQIHYDRVIADGGVLPSGLGGVNSFFQVVKEIYGTSDINSVISAAYDPQVLGYKLGAGSGTTLGQAAQKLYSVKSTENLLFPSEDFANASWVKIGVTITSNSTIAPDGVLTADTFNGAAASYLSNNLLALTPQSYTTSIYVKKLATSSISIEFQYHQSGSDNTLVTFNFDTGVISGGTVETLANGWFRIRAITNIIANRNQLRIVSANSFYIWGIQLNTGSVALPYTPTTTTAETLADVVQTTAASQPLLLTHTSGENYWFGSGVSGNYCSTPNAAANQITGDIEIVVQTNRSTQSGFNNYLSKWSSGQLSFYLVNNNGFIVFTANSGSINGSSSVVNPISDGTVHFIKCTRNSTSGEIKFYTSLNGVTYTQLGTTINSGIGAINNSTAFIEIGTRDSGTQGVFQGKIYRATLANSIGGAPVVDFNPNQYNPSTSQTQWVSTSGETWTINTGTAATGYKGALVSKTIVMADGVDDTILSGTLANNQYFSQHVALNPLDIAFSPGQYYVDGGGAKGLIYAGNNNIRAYNGSADLTFTGFSDFRLQYLQADFNNPTTNVYLNNANNVSGATGTAISTKSVLFSNNGSGQFANIIINTVISANNSIDTPTQRTAMYNYIRSINNNAF